MTNNEKLEIINNLRKEKTLIYERNLQEKISILMSNIVTLAALYTSMCNPKLCALYLKQLNLFFDLNQKAITIASQIKFSSIDETIDSILDTIEEIVINQESEVN